MRPTLLGHALPSILEQLQALAQGKICGMSASFGRVGSWQPFLHYVDRFTRAHASASVLARVIFGPILSRPVAGHHIASVHRPFLNSTTALSGVLPRPANRFNSKAIPNRRASSATT
jgi:hypothetical protein